MIGLMKSAFAVVKRKHRASRSDSDNHKEQPKATLEGFLNVELLEHILSFLTHREAAGARMTCRTLREVKPNENPN